jgi:hypothetical protein
MPKNASWQSLGGEKLPTNHLNLEFPDFNPKLALDSFDFAGFVRLDETMSSRPLFDFANVAYYFDSYSIEKIIAERNHYGGYFSIDVGNSVVRFQEMSGLLEDCQETAMRLLKHLAIELNRECRWEAYSQYEDSGEYSEIRTGTDTEIRALFADFKETK